METAKSGLPFPTSGREGFIDAEGSFSIRNDNTNRMLHRFSVGNLHDKVLFEKYLYNLLGPYKVEKKTYPKKDKTVVWFYVWFATE